MLRIHTAVCMCLLLVSPMAAQPDVVTDWNEVTLDAIRATNSPPTMSSRLLAMVHIAMYDAVNGVEWTYHPFYVKSRARANTSPDAAAVAAAYTVLVTELPTLQGTFYRERVASLSMIPDGNAKQNGLSWGTYVGQVVAYMRASDGWNVVQIFPGIYEPGYWRPTPPAYAPAFSPGWGHVKPFGIASAADFTPPPPPGITTRAYAQAVNDVKRFGAKNSIARTDDQTQTALFWADDHDSISPPGRWNKIAQSASEYVGSSLYENARLFALLNIAMADACTAAWECKYHYALWRPITAIREADSAGNPLVKQAKNWTPLINTPAHPEYVSGHSTFAGAAAEVLALFYDDDDIPFDLYSEVMDVTRSYSSFSQACQEDGRSRIYGGIHYQFSNLTGQKMGREIGQYVYEHVMLPL